MIATVECPHCRTRVNTTGSQTVLCTNCLQDFVPPDPGAMRKVAAIRSGARLLFAIVVGSSIGVGTMYLGKLAALSVAVVEDAPAPPVKPASDQPIDVGRDVELRNAFLIDEPAADAKYKGKLISFRMTAMPALGSRDGNHFLSTTLTTCSFKPDKAIKLTELETRPPPHVRGVCLGRVEAYKSVWGWVVAVVDCDIVTDP